MLSIFQRLAQTRTDSVNKKSFRSALIVGSLSVVARTATIFKEQVVARFFGRGDSFDAFLIAFLLPSFVLTLVMGALGSAMVPVLLETHRKQGHEATERLLSAMVLISGVVLIAIALLLAIFAPYYLPYLAHGFSPAKVALTRKLLYFLLPWLVFSGMTMFAAFVLNAGERFALPALAPLLTPLITIAFVGIGAKVAGPFALAAGTMVGSLLEAAVLFHLLRMHGVRLRLEWKGLDPNVRAVLIQYAPLMAGALLVGSTPVVDQAMAAMLPSGSVSALSYGNKLISGIVAIGANALGTALLPYFSRMAVEHDWQGCRQTLKRYFGIILLATVPLTLVLIQFSHPIVKLLFQRGAFSRADTELVSWVQICYAIQIPFNMLGILFVRFISAVRRNDLLMYVTAVNLLADVVLNLVLMKKWGVAGIALSTSLVCMISFLLMAGLSVWLLYQERSSTVVVAQAQQASQQL